MAELPESAVTDDYPARGQIWDHRRIAGLIARVVGDPLVGFVTIDTVSNGLPDGRHLLTVANLRASWAPRGAS